VIAGRSGTPAGKGLVQQLQVDDLVGFHEEPIGKTTTAGAAGLIAQQLDRSVEDSVIVRFEDALLVVIHQPKHARLVDSDLDFRNRSEQRHPKPLWRVDGRPISPGNRSGQNATNRGPADLKPAGDFSFGDTGPVQFADLCSVESGRDRAAQPFAVQPGLHQSGTSAFPKNLAFELSILWRNAKRG
jgi:hypothetical protein